jgi:L-lactate utilization protein LutB
MVKKNWSKIPGNKEIEETISSLKNRGFRVFLVENKEEALEKIKELIPKGAEIMYGSSTTLEEIGFFSFLQSKKTLWKDLSEEIKKENDQTKRQDLRRKAVVSDYFLGSVNAISKNGELVACDASGSRVGAYLFAAKNLILVSGIQKITPNLESAIKRVREYVFPLENERAKKIYGMSSATAKWVIIEKEFIPNRITIILVKEKLGF